MNNNSPQNYTPLQESLMNGGGVSSGSKELEPHGSPNENFTYHEAQEHEPKKETSEFIESTPETIKIDADLEKLGVSSVKSTKFPNFQEVELPISDEKIVEGLQEPVDSSFRWLAEFALAILKRAHATIKKIHGKIVRISTA
ncbi:MAG: hypothetical protein WEC80_02435 [Patescibacteria group bacterium]